MTSVAYLKVLGCIGTLRVLEPRAAAGVLVEVRRQIVQLPVDQPEVRRDASQLLVALLLPLEPLAWALRQSRAGLGEVGGGGNDVFYICIVATRDSTLKK